METLYKNKLHQLMHLLQIKCMNVVCGIQQLRLRRWKFILEQYKKRKWHAFYLPSITLLQNIANTLFDTIGGIKGPLLYYIRFEMILHSLLLSQKCRQQEHTSLRDCLLLPSNSLLKMIRRQLPVGSFYMCLKFQPKLSTQ